jgi:hypothetical protein
LRGAERRKQRKNESINEKDKEGERKKEDERR